MLINKILIRKKLIITFLTIAFNISSYAELWEQDYDQALKKSKSENKCILIDFSGSDWCGWCIRLDKEVFATKEFQEFAKKNLVCYLADFPRKKSIISVKQQKANNKLKATFQPRGFPTVYILDPQGKQIAQTGYKKGGPKAYIKHLKQWTDKYKAKAPVEKITKSPAFRTWRNSKGKILTAVLLTIKGKEITVQMRDGKQYNIPVSDLSDNDKKYVAIFASPANKALLTPFKNKKNSNKIKSDKKLPPRPNGIKPKYIRPSGRRNI